MKAHVFLFHFSTYIIPSMAQEHLARDNLQIKFFKLESWSPGEGFFPIAAINLLSLERFEIRTLKTILLL